MISNVDVSTCGIDISSMAETISALGQIEESRGLDLIDLLGHFGSEYPGGTWVVASVWRDPNGGHLAHVRHTSVPRITGFSSGSSLIEAVLAAMAVLTVLATGRGQDAWQAKDRSAWAMIEPD